MRPWHWFLAADNVGQWIITEGVADVEMGRSSLRATLRFSGDSGETPYHDISGDIDADGFVTAIVKSPRSGNAPFQLQGRIGSADVSGQGVTISIVITDGTTIIGLSSGP